MKKIYSIFLAFFLLVGTANANLITNGGFETGDITGWSCVGADRCDTATGAWANSGTYGMTGYDNSGYATLSQTISTIIGETYDFSFFSRTTFDNPANILTYITGSGSTLVPRTTFYALTTESFIATQASTVISFLFETDSGTGMWSIDDVSVVASSSVVPIPAAAWLFVSGLLGVIGLSKRKKTAA